MEKLFFLAEIVICTLCFLMGVVFLVLPVPGDRKFQGYRISLKVLAVDYIVLGLLDFISLLFWEESHVFGYFNFIRALVSSLQAFLFTFALLNLLNPRFITWRRLLQNLLPLATFVLAYVASLLFFGDYELQSLSQLGEGVKHPTMAIRLLFFVFYAAQLGYFCHLFYIEAKQLKKGLEDYFSDTHQLNLKSYLNLLRGAIVIGVMALVSLVQSNLAFESFFAVATIIFYFLFAIKFINYTKIFVLIEPAILPQPEIESAILGGTIDIPDSDVARGGYNYNWKKLRSRIVDEQHYLKEQVTLEDIAQTLRISRTTLSNLINSEEGQNFYSWINSLRIEYAKSLILDDSGYTIAQIARVTGFTETSNFSRTFKNITGLTPTEWRKCNSEAVSC